MPDFRPFDMKGREIGESFRNWAQLNVQPYDKLSVDAYTRCRVLLMTGIENQSVLLSHALSRLSGDQGAKKLMALVRRADSQHQQLVSHLYPADQTVLETSVGYEQMVVDLTADLARNESDPCVRQALDFALLEDFDHLFRFGCLLELLEGVDPNAITQGRTEIKPGRPTAAGHRHPYDSLGRHYRKDKVWLETRLACHAIVAAEQQTLLFYRFQGNRHSEPLARGLYAEIAEMEEQHLSRYETLADPGETALEKLALAQLAEAYLYYANAQTEPDVRLRAIWEELCEEEIGHFLAFAALMREIEGRDLRAVLGVEAVSPLVTFHENKTYVDQVLESQLDLRPYKQRFVRQSELPRDWPSFAYDRTVSAGWEPSLDVAEQVYAQDKVPAVSLELPGLEESRKDLFFHLADDHTHLKSLFQEILSGGAGSKEGLFKELSRELYGHMRAEYEVLYLPLKDDEKTRGGILVGMEEHHVAEQMLTQLVQWGMAGDESMAKLAVLRDLFLRHLTKEEGVVFQHVRRIMDGKAALEAGRRFLARKKEIMLWGGPGRRVKIVAPGTVGPGAAPASPGQDASPAEPGPSAAARAGAGSAPGPAKPRKKPAAGRRRVGGAAGARAGAGQARGARADASQELRNLKVGELRQRAKQAGISGYSRMKKDELIAALGKKMME